MSDQEVKAKGKKSGKKAETDGEPKAPRDRTSRNFDKSATIGLLIDKNPKREGSKSFIRFDAYKDGMTVGDFITAGGTYGDLAWDSARGFVAISGYTPKAVVKKEKKAKEEVAA